MTQGRVNPAMDPNLVQTCEASLGQKKSRESPMACRERRELI